MYVYLTSSINGITSSLFDIRLADLHRNLFRSDVLVVYHPPILVSPSTHPLLLSTPTQPVSETAVRELTAQIETDIRSGTLYAPSWLFIRLGNSARRLYAPLGTALSLGEHVRLTKQFVELFVGREGEEKSEVVATLGRDLKIYQDLLYLHGIKDDRVRNVRMLRRTTLYKRLLVRSVAAIGFMLLSAPGILLLWSPIFVVTRYMSEKAKKTGPVFDTYDEVSWSFFKHSFLSTFSYPFRFIELTPLPASSVVRSLK